MELIWCFIIMRLGEQRGRGGPRPQDHLPAQSSVLPRVSLGVLEPGSLLPCPPLPPVASPSRGGLSECSLETTEGNPSQTHVHSRSEQEGDRKLEEGYEEPGASLVARMVKNQPAMQETQIQSLGQEDPLEKGRAAQSSMYSCLENPMDRGAWRATVHRVMQSRQT